MELRRRIYILGLFLTASFPAVASAKVLLSQKEALALAFPEGTKVERKTAFLTDAQASAAETDAGSPLGSHVWTYYVGTSSQGVAGTAYFESHKVRTMNETFMVVVDPDASVRFVEILSFAEPDEYMAPKKWLGQFGGKTLTQDLLIRRGLRNITGASITSEAVTRGVRRVLAVHRVLNGAPSR
ncbi:MAG: FMN-binding protein [Elusimicrobia bacterium]|nr:FMN-binding protein [Elusimicrobiota bacterium]